MRKLLLMMALGAVIAAASCKKDYYNDSGLQRGVYDGNTYEWLQTNPFLFDSLVTIIRLAELENVIKDSTITFFAPTDRAIKMAMNTVHEWRYSQFKDSLRLEEVPGEVWRKYLSRYIFKDKYKLKDVPRLSVELPDLYPGMNLESLQGQIMNIGVVFSNYNGTKDVGPRMLVINSIGSLERPAFNIGFVATSDMQTRNAVVHVLDAAHYFGFDGSFINTVKEYIQ